MLVIVYKQIGKNTSIQVPPIFIKIDELLLVQTTEELISNVHQQFKDYISPFITLDHLELQLKNGEILYRKLPLFMYFNYAQPLQYINCQVKCADKIKSFNDKKIDELYFNIYVRISNRWHSQKGEILIIRKNVEKQLQELDLIIKESDKVYINGKQIVLSNNSINWSKFIREKWEILEHIRNRCLFICIDRAT